MGAARSSSSSWWTTFISGAALALAIAWLVPVADLVQRSGISVVFPTTYSQSHSLNVLTFTDAVENRRSIYQLTKKSPITDSRIEEVLILAIKNVPSAFNSQSARIVALLRNDHDRFWSIVEDALRLVVDEQDWSKTADRMSMFKNAYGTVLFYEDDEIIQGLQAKMPAYADKFPQWSEHTSAMHQYMLWTAFEAEGLGCSLQHYNPLADDAVAEAWNIPRTWKLKAQLVFGHPVEGAREQLRNKTQEPVKERLFIHGA